MRAWVGDEFAVAFSRLAEEAPLPSMSDLYRDLYLSVSGSHVSLYNADHYGALAGLGLGEFSSAP